MKAPHNMIGKPRQQGHSSTPLSDTTSDLGQSGGNKIVRLPCQKDTSSGMVAITAQQMHWCREEKAYKTLSYRPTLAARAIRASQGCDPRQQGHAQTRPCTSLQWWMSASKSLTRLTVALDPVQ